jgi:hypothetical protein
MRKLLILAVFVATALIFVARAFASETPTCQLDVVNTPGSLEVAATVGWSTSNPEGWHKLDWGDGKDLGFQGLSGERTESHTYESPDTYTVTFTTDAVDGDEPSCTKSEDVTVSESSSSSKVAYLPITFRDSGSVIQGPFCQITDKVGSNTHERTATITWSGAKEEWWLLYWGDENQTKAEPPGFFGSAGEESFPHVYNSGNYTQKATVESDSGKSYTCTNEVVVP